MGAIGAACSAISVGSGGRDWVLGRFLTGALLDSILAVEMKDINLAWVRERQVRFLEGNFFLSFPSLFCINTLWARKLVFGGAAGPLPESQKFKALPRF